MTENMALGLAEGFSAEMDGIGRKIKNSIPTEFDTQLNINARGQSGGVAGGFDYGKIAAAISDVFWSI